MHVGLIVGIGPAATDFYYRTLIDEMGSRERSLDLTMAHADTRTLLRNQERGDVESQVALYLTLTQRLRAAGAEIVAITSIAGHFCVREFTARSPLPVIDIGEVMRRAIQAEGLERVGLLGTKPVMVSGFSAALGDVEVVAPPSDVIDRVHAEYITVAQSGRCSDDQRSFFFNVGERMTAEYELDAILLAGTDLTLVFDGHAPRFPVLDCARLHALEIARIAEHGAARLDF